jgi:hypothetical protein
MKSLKINMTLIPTIITTLGLTALPAAVARDRCGGHSGDHTTCGMAGHAKVASHEGDTVAPVAAAGQTSTPLRTFMEPVQSVFDNYIKIEGALAQDSVEGVAAAATSIGKAVRGDSMKMLSPRVAEQAEALAQAKDLASARAAFKPLSESLIRYVRGRKAAEGAYHEVYCPMAKASWLQTDKSVRNPYMGKAMIHCGVIKS